MEKRVRSPSYPALSLPDAVVKVSMLYKSQHTHAAPRALKLPARIDALH